MVYQSASSTAMLRLLLEKGVDVNKENKHGVTPFNAVKRGRNYKQRQYRSAMKKYVKGK